ncbi:BQ2448_7217 [Microbotryum intermedium]|uniref:BQ2448_7217 protein n=1 Tax=Microbotryum intermedium TaxID=269621 RepID=A0A238FMA7_9BASI|nr:BQ2448_7217 [Microbotryum intermedium]
MSSTTPIDVDYDTLESQPFSLSDVNDTHPETARLLAELDRKKANRSLYVPTKDVDVKERLRSLAQPITLFGERPEDRRDRLREVLGKLREENRRDKKEKREQREARASGGEEGKSNEEEEEEEEEEEDEDDDGSEPEVEDEEEFYTEGSQELKDSRRWIAQYSLPRWVGRVPKPKRDPFRKMSRAKARIQAQRLEANVKLGRLMDVRRAVYGQLKQYTNLGSQIGDSRPLGPLKFSPDGQMLLTSSWTGMAKLWNVPSCKEVRTLKAHKERIGGVAWHPTATIGQSTASVNFATSGADKEIKLWNLEGSEPLSTLTGHSARVSRIAFHPSGHYLGSTSYDGTFRLWSIETSHELLLQEGHSKEVYSLAFQADGSLACTGGLDAIGRVWDLRSGRTAMVLDGHVKDVLAMDFAPNGHQIVSGSNDDTIRVWDLRALKSVYTIPAHKSAVADLTFFKSGAHTGEWKKIPRGMKGLSVFDWDDEANKDVKGPKEGEQDLADVPLNGSYLVSGGYDGTVKVWSADDWQLVKTLTADSEGKVMGVDVSPDARFIASSEYSRTFKLWSTPEVDLA